MNKPHIHAAVIKAWADGADIEWRYDEGDTWKLLAPEHPYWQPHYEYRVKPKTQERWVNVYHPCYGFASKEKAQETALAHHKTGSIMPIACVKVVFTEGEGL